MALDKNMPIPSVEAKQYGEHLEISLRYGDNPGRERLSWEVSVIRELLLGRLESLELDPLGLKMDDTILGILGIWSERDSELISFEDIVHTHSDIPSAEQKFQ